MMEFEFKDIKEGYFKAKLSHIKKAHSAYGPYLRLTFTIIEDNELANQHFCGMVKPSPIKQSKFYRWITNILGHPPQDKLCSKDIIGQECMIYLAKHNNYYTVIDVSMKTEKSHPS